jgi:ribose transport system permease protein
MSNKTMSNKKLNIKQLTGWLERYSFIVVFIAIMIAYGATIELTGKTFNFGHISAVLSSQNSVIVGTMALGMALVIITGQIDLSVGSALVLTTGTTIVVFNTTGDIFLTFLAALIAGFFCGAVNGLLVGYANMPPFIVTLGTMLIYRSLGLYLVRAIPASITGSRSSQFAMLRPDAPMISDAAFDGLRDKLGISYELLRNKFGTGSLRLGSFAIPFIAFLFFGMVVLLIILSQHTKYGKSVYATGSNEKAARLTGINVRWVKISVFMITGILVGVASFIQACKIGNITPAQSGQSYEMYAIAAVVLGGINMSGGRGSLLGVLFGALSYTAINFIIVSVPAFSIDIQNTFQGLVLILVILVQTAGPAFREQFIGRRRKS